MPDQESPMLNKGDTWRTSRLARQIVDLNIGPDGVQNVRYRTEYGEYVCTESEFRFWIERWFAWAAETPIGGME
jgi:hypothetical protein